VRGYDDLITRAGDMIPDGSDVVAQSMGGLVAIGLALAQPDKVRRLVLVATSGGLDIGRHGGADWREEYLTEFPGAAAWVTEQGPDYSEQMYRITVPTCLIWGDADRISPTPVGRALQEALPASVLHVIRGGTHMLARERPDEVAALVAGHLAPGADRWAKCPL